MYRKDALTVAEIIELEKNVLSGSLRLSGFELEEIPPAIFQMHHLRDLNLSNNKIKFIPNEIEKLSSLRSFSLLSNELEALPESICSLSSLENLDIGMNKLNYLPADIEQLSNLKYLRIGSNLFDEVPESIKNLKELRNLIANDLELDIFPLCVTQLPQLQTLNLTNNAFTEIPKEFVDMQSLRRLMIDADTISNIPIEILSRSPGAIINYLHAFDEMGDTFFLREAKLIIVGEGAVGKTALMNRLLDGIFDETIETTEGIDIKTWDVQIDGEENLKLNVWDFGGQEIYHSTHQFFLTRRSLYLFVWDARKEDNILNFDYWLNVVSLLSERSSIICVQNKIDERMTTIDEDAIIKKFPNVCAFKSVSSATGKNIDDLVKGIIKEVTNLDHIGDTLPSSWSDIKSHLIGLNKNFIKKNEYLSICKNYGLDEQSAAYLSQYYHDLGVFLHFSDNKILEQIIFLDPEWATGAVYELIDYKEIQHNHGRFNFRDLKRYWKKYERGNHIHFIELMKRFELCFEIGDSGEFIIPELLSHRRQEIAIGQSILHFEYHYDFMPAGIISRFIVRCNDLIRGNHFWRTGVVIHRETTQAMVISDPLSRKLKISIWGDNKSHLLAIIRRELAEIHKTLNNPDVIEMLPCPCSSCLISKDSYYHSFEYLKRAKAKRKYYVECKNSLEDINIKEIMDGLKRTNLVDYNVDWSGNIPDTIKIGEIMISTAIDKRILNKYGMDVKTYSKFAGELSRLSEGRLLELEKLISSDDQINAEVKSNKVMQFAKDSGISISNGAVGSGIVELLSGMFI